MKLDIWESSGVNEGRLSAPGLMARFFFSLGYRLHPVLCDAVVLAVKHQEIIDVGSWNRGSSITLEEPHSRVLLYSTSTVSSREEMPIPKERQNFLSCTLINCTVQVTARATGASSQPV